MPSSTKTPLRRPIVVTVPEAADILRISRAQVYALMSSGQLRRLQIGTTRSVRIPLADVYTLLGIDPDDGATL
jgi:excisionase family DNA binding protein